MGRILRIPIGLDYSWFLIFALLTWTLALFNLIPGFPLGGGRVFRAIVWGMTHNLRRATLVAGNLGRFIGYLFILLGVWQMFTGNLLRTLSEFSRH